MELAPWTPDLKAAFDRDGFVVWRKALPIETIDRLLHRFGTAVDGLIDKWIESGTIESTPAGATPGERYATMRAGKPAKFPIAWRRILVSPEVYGMWQNPSLLEAARDLIDGPIRAHGTWNGRPREPNAPAQKVGWHQDLHYEKGWNPDDPPVVSMWMPLVDVGVDGGALQYLPGSHRLDVYPFEADPDNAAALLEIPAAKLPDIAPVTIEVGPGDVILFDNRVCHRALPNTTDGFTRFSLDIRFGPDNAKQRDDDRRGFAIDAGLESYDTWVERHGYTDEGMREELGFPAALAAMPSDQLAAALEVDASDFGVF